MEKKILIERNVKCSELTMDDFVKMMSEDLKNAEIIHREFYLPIEVERYNFYIQSRRHAYISTTKEFAEKKWKTEKKRKAYIDKEIEKFDSNVTPFKFYGISFFDFKVDPGKNIVPGCCSLNVNASEEQLKKCFEYIKQNEYFNAALGWKLVDYRGFRPQIELKLDEEFEKKFEAERKALEDDIARFYRNSTYCGD